ncbi:MAG: hypothetical protein C4548_04745 [Desulfobacteraceae bacterium]|jgi:acyl-CoA synthetase (NDP forming)|nr:MAG: hypothetical protein C4548_04745 [Desulfobacteraceae bacterium]
MDPLNASTDYERIFHPERIAIIGVSGKGAGFGARLFYSLRAIGYAGEIFLVNPKGGQLDGHEIYESIEAIPGGFDLAIIAVAASAVPEALEACRLKGAAAAEILSAGFSELGTPEGMALEKQIMDVAARGIRVIGPNCFGMYVPKSGLTVLPGPDLSREPGPVAFSSQSGGMAVDFANMGKSTGLTFSKVVSFGNGVDLRETELLDYFGQDMQTRIIAMYIEGVKNGDAFFKTLKKVAAHKPVIVMKGGLSAAGSRAVLSHTASMGGSARIWEAILKQANAVQVFDMSEMARTCLAFTHLQPGTYRHISVLGGGGALGVAAADAAEAVGMKIPPFSPDLKTRIDDLLPRPGSSGANPVDVANPFVAPQVLKDVLLLAAEDDRIELQILITLFHHYKTIAQMMGMPVKDIVPYNELAVGVAEVIDKTSKPVVLILNNPKRGLDHMDVVEMIEEARRAFLKRGIPVFDDLKEAMGAIGHINAYYGGKTDE